MALTPLDDVRRTIVDAVSPLHPTAVHLGEAVGCVTSIDLTADEPVPPFANTAMDGYAVRAADTTAAPATLRVVDTIAAGRASEREVGPGEAMRIMTGAPMPPGADAVVMVERAHSDDEGATVVVEAAASPGDHVRPAGDDLAPGDVAVAAFTELRPPHAGVLASLGYQRVPVFPRPRVGVLSTGEELVDGAAALAPGQIRDANRPMLLGVVESCGFTAVDLGVVGDDDTAITTAIEAAVASCNAVVTTGGVSVGDYDYVKAVLARLGDYRAWQVAIKPAKPLSFAMVGGVPVFGLPGNPVSCAVSFLLFAWPALRRMAGHRSPGAPRIRAVADEALTRRPDGKLHLVRVEGRWGEDGRYHVRSAGGQGSHQLAGLAAADGLAFVPDGDGIAAGADVDVMVVPYG